MDWEKYKSYGPILVRYGVGIVFLLFGLDQLFNPGNWLAWLPIQIGNLGISLESEESRNEIFIQP